MVVAAVRRAAPDVVIQQLTAIPTSVEFRHLDKAFALTNRLRTEALDNLLLAAREAGARRFIAQSFGGWPYAKTGGPVKSEDDPLDPSPHPAFRSTLEAIRYLERRLAETAEFPCLALRYGFFYGPETSFARGGAVFNAVRARRIPIVGNGDGIWSFIHMDDVAAATVAAIERGNPGIYNIIDDEPAPVHKWLPHLANALGAKPPRHVPAFLARLFIGSAGVEMMTKVRGASNAKAKRELAWQLRFPTWRTGFQTLLDGVP